MIPYLKELLGDGIVIYDFDDIGVPEAADQNMLNWAAWLRMHHKDPEWTPNVIQEDAANIMDFSRLSALKSYEGFANIKILDTSNLALHEVFVIENKITSYNNSKVPFIQKQPFINLNFCIKDDSGLIIAAITSLMYCWGILFVDILVVDKKYYKNGLGSKLLTHVENEAKKLGAILAHLDSFDFQAKDFYLKHGYEVFGILDDCPKGHKRYYMKKLLV